MKASWQGVVIAESEKTVILEGNHYFPSEAIVKQHFEPSQTESVCPWKGKANYYTIVVNGMKNLDAAWFYQEPKNAAEKIKNHVAFWKGVEVLP